MQAWLFPGHDTRFSAGKISPLAQAVGFRVARILPLTEQIADD
jgi:hypothetical protein